MNSLDMPILVPQWTAHHSCLSECIVQEKFHGCLSLSRVDFSGYFSYNLMFDFPLASLIIILFSEGTEIASYLKRSERSV
jgi:hypothetical protein